MAGHVSDLRDHVPPAGHQGVPEHLGASPSPSSRLARFDAGGHAGEGRGEGDLLASGVWCQPPRAACEEC